MPGSGAATSGTASGAKASPTRAAGATSELPRARPPPLAEDADPAKRGGCAGRGRGGWAGGGGPAVEESGSPKGVRLLRSCSSSDPGQDSVPLSSPNCRSAFSRKASASSSSAGPSTPAACARRAGAAAGWPTSGAAAWEGSRAPSARGHGSAGKRRGRGGGPVHGLALVQHKTTQAIRSLASSSNSRADAELRTCTAKLQSGPSEPRTGLCDVRTGRSSCEQPLQNFGPAGRKGPAGIPESSSARGSRVPVFPDRGARGAPPLSFGTAWPKLGPTAKLRICSSALRSGVCPSAGLGSAGASSEGPPCRC